ncbi:MAG: flagellar hook-basal body complex protein FliE [Acidobacteriota bacterium]|nr:flagellar hook-basal body complex protein FliE [Acidobacteriota bacterium]
MSSMIPGLGALGSIAGLPKLPSLTPAETGEGFGGVLKAALQQVNQLSGGAEQQIGSLLQGGNADMSTVMIAVEKADVAFQLMMQVRNKIVNAYQDIEKMQF